MTSEKDASDASDENPSGVGTARDVDQIEVAGRFANEIATIGAADMSLVLAVGLSASGAKVMVPLVEVELEGLFDGQKVETSRFVGLTFDNAAFLAERLADSLLDMMPVLASMASGPIKPLDERLAFSIDCFERAHSSLSLSIDSLKALRTG